MVIQDAVVDTPHAGDPAGVCRLKYDRLGEAPKRCTLPAIGVRSLQLLLPRPPSCAALASERFPLSSACDT